MSWICVGCHQVQESKDKFAPVMNHTHTLEEQKDPALTPSEWTTPAIPAGLTADELAKLRTEMKGMTAEELKQLLGEL